MRQRKKGFTLIELLVVISIIAVLLSILMPALRMAKEKTRLLICLSNVRQVTIACIAYATANDGLYPLNPISECYASPNYFNGVNLTGVCPDSPGNNFALDLEPYLKTLGLFTDPSVPHSVPIAEWDMASESVWTWWYLGGNFETTYGLKVKNERMSSKAGIPLFSDHCIDGWGSYGEVRTNHIVRNGTRYPATGNGYGDSYHCWNVPFAGEDDLKYVKRLNAGYNDGSTRAITPEKMVKIGDWFPEGIESP